MNLRKIIPLVLICLVTLAIIVLAPSNPLTAPLTLIPLDKQSEVLLVSEKGKAVHSWKVDTPRAYLQKNGDLIALHGTHSKRNKKAFQEALKKISRYSWNGDEIWSYRHSEKLHHDFAVHDEGLYLLSHKYIDGFFKERSVPGVPPSYRLRLDTVVNIDFDGNMLWEWALDPKLFDEVGCKFLECFANVQRRYPVLNWAHFNALKIIPPNKHYEEGVSAFRPGNILLTARNWRQVLILDISTKEIVWEYPEVGKEQALNGVHEASLIRTGLQGEGEILIFENGAERPGKGNSKVLSINPITREVIWSYQADGFFSEYQGSAQRLVNGNTFISSDYQRTCFEVNSAGQIQWAYTTDHHLYRCRRYEAGHLEEQ